MFNLRIVKDYLKHRFKAKTRHGLHSPFVYRLVDKVVYDFSPKKVLNDLEALQATVNQRPRERKLNRLLYRIVADYQANNVFILGETPTATVEYIKVAAPNTIIPNEPTEIINIAVIDTKNFTEARDYFNRCLLQVDEHSLIIIKNIYGTDGMKTLWNDIKNNPRVTVTVDLFMVGLVYFRKGQVREDFWIKF